MGITRISPRLVGLAEQAGDTFEGAFRLLAATAIEADPVGAALVPAQHRTVGELTPLDVAVRMLTEAMYTAAEVTALTHASSALASLVRGGGDYATFPVPVVVLLVVTSGSDDREIAAA